MCKFLVLWCVFVVSFGVAASQQISPCPDVFQYCSDGGPEIHGIILIRSPPFGTRIVMSVEMSIAASVPTRYVGRLETLDDRDDVTRSTLTYKVHFPLSSPLPTPVQIIFNGQTICQGHSGLGAHQVTMVKMDYESSIEAILQNGNYSGISSNQKTNIVIRDVFRYYHKTSNNPKYYLIGYGSEDYELIPNAECYRKGPKEAEFSTSKSDVSSNNHKVSSNNHKGSSSNHNVSNDNHKGSSNSHKGSSSNHKGSSNSHKGSNDSTISSYQCGVPVISPKPQSVDSGSPERGEWPWMVAIFMRKKDSLTFVCSGTLISNKHVVTTARCTSYFVLRDVESENAKRDQTSIANIILQVGIYNLRDWSEAFSVTSAVKSIEKPPYYSEGQSDSGTGDIDIIILKKPVTFNKYIIPVCLWEGSNDLAEVVGQRGTILGWGMDEEGEPITNTPGKIDVPIVSNEACLESNSGFSELLNNRTFCAGERNGLGPCIGDQGGGLYLKRGNRWMIRGVISSLLLNVPADPCSLTEYVVYADITKYDNWIRRVLDSS